MVKWVSLFIRGVVNESFLRGNSVGIVGMGWF